MAKTRVVNHYHGSKKGSNKLLIVGGIGVVAYLLYRRSQTAALTASAVPGTLNTTTADITNPPVTVTRTAVQPGTVPIPTITRADNTNRPAAVSTQPSQAIMTQSLIQWAGAKPDPEGANLKKVIAIMTPTEISQLYDCIATFGTGAQLSAQQQANYNAIGTKYHIYGY